MIKISIAAIILFFLFLLVRMIQPFFHHRRFMNEFISHANDPAPSIDPKNIPQNLRHLSLIAEKWAIFDDCERHNMQEGASLQEKQIFLHAVWPHMEEIETWVNQEHEKPSVSYEATIFMFLTEAAAEIKGELEQNKGH